MSRQIQFRRGTATEHNTFTGAAGELTVDTTTNTVRVHDGLTPGGTPLARADSVPTDLSSADYVVAYQSPTAENNYSWYRRYKSGWIEQGGRVSIGSLSDGSSSSATANFCVPMANTNYTILCTPSSASAFNRLFANAGNFTTLSASIGVRNIGGATAGIYVFWYVNGLIA